MLRRDMFDRAPSEELSEQCMTRGGKNIEFKRGKSNFTKYILKLSNAVKETNYERMFPHKLF